MAKVVAKVEVVGVVVKARIEHGGAPVHSHGGGWHGPWETHKDTSLHANASAPEFVGDWTADQKALYAKALAGEFKVNWTARAKEWAKAGGEGYLHGKVPAPKVVQVAVPQAQLVPEFAA